MLDGVSLDIAENRTTAFVGSSGAGKSTLLDLVLGLLQPTAGRIESVVGRSRTTSPTWYAGLGVVPQDVFLLNDTLAANIAFGVLATSDDRRAGSPRSSRWPSSMTLVADLPDGLDTVVGERGVRLSGGQRQRHRAGSGALSAPPCPGARRGDLGARQRDRARDRDDARARSRAASRS